MDNTMPTPAPTPAPDEKSILHEAHDLIHGARRTSYGPPHISFGRIAALATIMLPYTITERDVATFMICVKLARERALHDRDNLVDLCGYADLLQQLHATTPTTIPPTPSPTPTSKDPKWTSGCK